MIESFILVYALNLIADFPLQGSYLASEKCKDNYILFVHSFIWAACVSAGFYLTGYFSLQSFMFLLVGHFVIDYAKCRGKYVKLNQKYQLYIDQLLHLIQILIVFIVKGASV